MSKILSVSSNPHDRSSLTTTRIMLDVIIALIPATVFGVWNFGIKAAVLVIACIVTCVLTEFLFEKITKRPVTIDDLSAAVTGLLLGLNLPVSAPVWMAVLGSIFAILVAKQFFGGLGQNFMNPALAGRCFLVISFASLMTDFTYDGISSATPLAVIKNGGTADILDMFLGTTAGTIGETSTLALLIGAIYLLARGIIDIRIPASYIISLVLFMVIFSGNLSLTYIAGQICGGGLMLGAFFMATDYVTSPITKKGRIVFGIALGLLTAIFRYYGSSAEGVSYAIIFCNLLVPLIEKVTKPKAFGLEGKSK